MNLRNQLCTVIGAGPVAARKAAALLRAGAKVRVIAPGHCEEMRALGVSPGLICVEKEYAPGDLRGSTLVFAATDSPEVNAAVCREAQELGVPVNVADDPHHCTFFLPAVVHRHPIAIAISTEGTSPALARLLRERVEEAVPPAYGHLALLLGRLRPAFVAAIPSPDERRGRVQRVLESDALSLLLVGQHQEAEQLVREILGLPQ